ncbi:DUF4810 domain-containing protein [Solimicrobium silvestre]|uniref:Lipoprotein n=1 Tax=Solimicrobium silvestre TaxID=2099400 RepID=A0A2S9GVF9_9BURK|nr:DUF4810 domain-containing protein [Solimicrobium silvestre]PRC91715.1 hypothetical protein S2091_3653 [Solimicrobium silvestre]
MTKKIVITLAAASVLLSGCHTQPKTLYQWEGYQPQVYQYFKGESPEQQIAILEKGLEIIKAKGNMPPPGYHAHLGLLYSGIGKQDQVIQEFQTEKTLFPESSAYMDFLLNKMKKSEQ